MANNSLLINQGTNSSVNFDSSGGTFTQVIAPAYGTISTIGTLPNIPGGSIVVTAGTFSNTGTTVQFNNGTVDSVTNIANLSKGTITKLEGGTLGNLVSGTINSATAVLNSGTINVGTFVMPSGTITLLPNLPQGSINVTAGTIATLGTMGTLGLVNTVTTVSNITNGSIVMTLGTVAAHAITAATITEGTLRNLISGTINSATAVINSATISVLPNLPQGSINVTAGTIATLGTMGTLGLVNTVTTVSNITNGSIVMTLGTVAAHAITAATVTAGTINTGTINLGTMVGKDANAAAQTGNPIGIGGTDSGGTIRTINVDSTGAVKTATTVNAAIGTISVGTINVGTFVMPSGTLTVLPNLPQGSINVTAGTIATLGTMGTLGLVNTVTTVSNITNGSIVQTVGTVNAGTINTGTINVGTFRDDGRAGRNIITFGTQVGNSGAIAATIVGSASIGAGTSQWIQDFSILNPSGSILVTLGFGTAQQGTNVLYRGVLGTQTAVGLEKPYAKAVNAGMTNQDLVLSLGAAGTVDLSISYFISA